LLLKSLGVAGRKVGFKARNPA